MRSFSYLIRTIIFLFTLSLAQASLIQSATAADLQIRSTKNGINYMTGGIGDEDTQTMRRHAKEFTLNLVFSEGETGQSVTEVNVNIYNEQSELVFRIKGAKPLLHVNLPAGTYTILATNNGEKLRHKLSISENTHQRVILNWKNEEVDALSREDSGV